MSYVNQVQGNLAHMKLLPPRILPEAYAWSPTVVLGGGALSYERGSPVVRSKLRHRDPQSGHQRGFFFFFFVITLEPSVE